MFQIELIIYIKMDLALNNLQRLICHKTQPTKTIPVHMDNINKTQANKTSFKKFKRSLSDSDSEIENQYKTEKFPNFIIIQVENT